MRELRLFPPIVDTIFRKIDNAAIFVPDLTFIGARLDGRPTSNPNVLIEYGWALKSLGHVRVVPVMNTAFGVPARETMPFNMLHLRNPIQFDCPAGADDGTRKKVRETLAKELEAAVGDVLSSDDFRNSQPVPPAPPVFRRQSPQDGLGKFRKPGEPLGVSETFPHIAQDVMLSEGPVVWFRLMPTIETGRTWPVVELKNAAMHGALLHPIGNGWREFNYLRGADGFGIYAPLREPRDLTSNVVFAFTSGELWTIDSYILDALMRDKRNVILPMENEFRKTLEEYSSFLTKLGIAPPFRWIAGMENLKGRSLIDEAGRMAAFRGPTGVCLSDVVIEEGTHSPSEAPGKSLEPFFTKLFDACGVGRPQARDT